MLTCPDADRHSASIVGIDPGSEHLGCAVLTFDLASFEIVAFEAHTFKGSKLPSSEWTGEIFTDRAQRLEAHQRNLLKVLRQVEPIAIACESPFYNKRTPNAYGVLTETVCYITQAIRDYDVWRTLYLIDPPTVKRAVGAPGNVGGAAGKVLVKEAMARVSCLMTVVTNNFPSWSEHAVDAGAVAYCQYLRMCGGVASAP